MKPKKVRNTVNNKAKIAPPVTQHIRAEEERDQLITEMAGNLQRISALHSVVAAASQSLDLDVVLQEVIKKISEIFHFDATRIYISNPEEDKLHLRASFEIDPTAASRLQVLSRGQRVAGTVWGTGEAMVFEDIQSDPRYQQVSRKKSLQRAGYSFLAGIPVKVKERSVGCIICIGRMPRSLTPDELQLITSMAGQIGIAVENALLFQETEMKAKRLSALYSVATAVNQSLDLDFILRNVMKEVLKIFDFDGARVYLFDEDSQELRLTAHEGFPDDVALPPSFKPGEGFTGIVFRKGEPVTIENIQNEVEFSGLSQYRFALKNGFRGYITFPIGIRDKTVGVMNFVSKEAHHFSASEVELIQSIADHVGIAIENARLYQESQRQEEIQTLLKELSQDITSLDLDSLLKKLTEKVREALKVDVSDVRVREKDRWPLLGISGIDPERTLSNSTGSARGRSGWIIQNRRPLLIPDISKSTAITGGESLLRAGIRGYLGVPLFSRGGEVVAVLRVLTYKPREFTQEEVDLLQQFANGAASALENSRLFMETEQRAQEQAALNTIANATSQSLQIEEVLQISLDKVLEVMGRERVSIERVSIMLEDAATGYLRLVAHRGISEEYAKHIQTHRTPGGKTDQVFESGRPLVINDPEGSILNEASRREGYKSMAWIPLKVQGKVIGILNVSTSRNIPFTPREVDLLEAIGNVIGVALENARLYQESKKQTMELEKSIRETEAAKHELEIDIAERKRVGEELRSSREQFRDLAAHLQSVREEERTQMAREVHDELGQNLTALKMDLSWLSKKLPGDQDPLVEKINSMSDHVDETVKMVRADSDRA